MSKIYIHCGLHKTGSTVLQSALSAHADSLNSAGVLFPRTGRLGSAGGQHNLAWQLAHDRRFEHQAGNLDGLFAEVGNFDGDIVLSSEDFESSVDHSEKWSPLLLWARSQSRKVVFVIYLRNQTSYLESLFQEMLKHGFGDSYEAYARGALSSGKVRIKEWVFHFDYLSMVDSLLRLPDVSLILRNYHSLSHGSPIADFASSVGLKSSTFMETASARTNVRDGTATSLELFYRNRVDRALTDQEIIVIHQLCAEFQLAPIAGRDLRRKLDEKFSHDNERLCDRFGLPTVGLIRTEGGRGDCSRSANIQRIFAFETQVTIREMSLIIAHSSGSANAVIDAELKDRMDAWRAWVSAF